MDKKQCDLIEVKEGWYNHVLKKPLKGAESSVIQYIIQVDGKYGIASTRPLTKEDIEAINFKEWTFMPFSEWEKEWKKESVQSSDEKVTKRKIS